MSAASYATAICRASMREIGVTDDWTLEPDAAATCLGELAARPCWDDDDPPACRAAEVGRVDAARPCSSTRECRGDLVCQGCPRRCTELGAAGTACSSTTECVADLGCVDGICGSGVVGGVCSSSRECPSGLVCSATTTTCAAPPGEGESCAWLSAEPCADRSLACADVGRLEGLCVRGGRSGEPCDSTRPCAPGHTCLSDGFCARWRSPAEPCSDRDPCLPGFLCRAGACAPQPSAGEACATDAECFEGLCIGGVCTLLEVGQACDATQCVTYCDFESRVCGALRRVAEPCEWSFQCETGLTCVPDGAGGMVCRDCR